MKCIMGFDVGGTNIKIGKFLFDDEKHDYVLSENYYIKTIIGENEQAILEQIRTEIDKNINDCELVGVGIGIPGPVKDGIVLKAQNINWEIVNVKEELGKFYPDVHFTVLNDANAATLGEWYYGSKEHVPNMVFVTLGTGIGGGIVVNGKLLEGANGSAGEIGHIKIFPFNGRPCTCGLVGCIEQYASATGIAITARGMVKNGPTSLKRKYHLNAKDVFDEAKKGDAIALEIVDKTCYYLAIALSAIANTINPNKIVIGGGVSKNGDFLLDCIKKHFEKLSFYSVKDTEITLATLFNDAGIYGCLYKTIEELNND